MQSLAFVENVNNTALSVSFIFNSDVPKGTQLLIFNQTGHLLTQKILSNQSNEILWDTKDWQGFTVKPGLYFYRIKGAEFDESGRILKIK